MTHSHPRDSRPVAPETVVVVGGGMVGWKLCALLREHAPTERFRIVLFGEEPRLPYDRVQLTTYMTARSADALWMAEPAWYDAQAIDLRVGTPIARVLPEAREVVTAAGERVAYDHLVLATGSSPFVPPLPGVDLPGVHVYRTIEDLEGILGHAATASRAIVLGGGLLGLEAARAVQERGLHTQVVELAPRLLPRQLDDAGAKLLLRSIEAMGVEVHLGRSPARILGGDAFAGLELSDGARLEADMLIVSAGIRPRDELARSAGLEVGERGGVVVDDHLRTSAPGVYCIGEAALHRGLVYGLVAPGYAMAEALAKRLAGLPARFEGSDLSAKLKLMGTDVASFGDPFADVGDNLDLVLKDLSAGVYKKLVLSPDATRLLGGILVGDTREYARLVHLFRTGEPLPERPEELILGRRGGGSAPVEHPDSMQVCSCNNVLKGELCARIAADGLTSLDQVKRCTRAGTGCGGCLPLLTELLDLELAKAGAAVKKRLCEHFDFTRRELLEIVRCTGIRTFEELIAAKGSGLGCEICKPAIASIFASVHNEMILERHASLQDTNDRFLANIQRRGLYSVVPRIPGGELTPERLIVLGNVARKYGLYTKITGGQRIDLFGARLNQLPDIWEDLVTAGFESGHAYAKALRTVKSCVGSTWCRYGQQDSVGFAIRVENRYKGIRAPHKLKSAVSGCIRECAEAQSKDFGIIATEKGWNLYVGGNGGSHPRHADLLAADLDEETCIRYIDRFLMFYINTADRLQRTARWLEKLEGGIEHLRAVVCDDRLGIAAELERQMQGLVDGYHCEWTEVVKDAEKAAAFRHFANSAAHDDTVSFVIERGQRRVADPMDAPPPEDRAVVRLPVVETQWVDVVAAADVPPDAGIAVRYGAVQLAVYHLAATGAWYATENRCPHGQDMVLARGLLGDAAGEPKVACPMHKKTFSLRTGECLSGESYRVHTFPARVLDGRVLVELPPVDVLEQHLCPGRETCHADAAE